MKFLKTFESVTDYKVEVLTADEFSDLYNKLYPYNYDLDENEKQFHLKDKIEFFDYEDMNFSFGGRNEGGRNEMYYKTRRLITAYNKEILGICKIAYFDLQKNVSVSYLSTNNDYFQNGNFKKIIGRIIQIFF